jgi:hypothetical protein
MGSANDQEPFLDWREDFFAIEGISLNVGILKSGPGFLPVMMGTLLVLFSLFILIKGLMKPKVFP